MALPSKLSFAAIAAALLTVIAIHAQDTPGNTTLRDLAPAIVPTPRLDVPWWAARHNAIVEQVREHRDFNLLLIGDSITQNYEKSSPPDEDFLPTWKQFYEPRRALNLGFSGDTTANLLWRLTHGEIDGLRPQAAIVLIGTNNTGHAHQTAEQTEAGIGNIVGTLTQRLPQTRILLLGILPSDVSPEKTAADKAINDYLAKRYGKAPENKPTGSAVSSEPALGKECHSERAERAEESPHSACPATQSTANGTTTHPQTKSPETDPRVTYLDIGKIFMSTDGALNTTLFYDPRLPTPGKPLHPDTRGQRMMAEAIEPTLAKLMYDKPRTTTASPAPAR